MNWETLSRRDVKVLSRDPATVKDPSIRLVFKHRGGESSAAVDLQSLMSLLAGVVGLLRTDSKKGQTSVHMQG